MDNSQKEKNFASAVVYCHNDAATISDFIQGLDQTLAENFLKYEMIVVNDSSTDNSTDIIRQYAAHKEGKAISLLNMSHPQGVEASMNAGIDLAIGDFVFEFDHAVCDWPWEMLMQTYRHSLKGFDIVSASLDENLRMTSRIYYRLFNRYANLQHDIDAESFRVLSRRAINRVHSITQSIPFRKAAYANCGLAKDRLKYKAVGDAYRGKRDKRIEIAVNSLILFTDIAYRITVGLSFVMMLFALAFGAYALVYRLLSHPVEGWATTIIFISFGFVGLFLIQAIIIKYLQVLVSLSFRKKEYLFESIEKLQ